MFGEPTVEDRNTDSNVDRDVFSHNGDKAFTGSIPVGELTFNLLVKNFRLGQDGRHLCTYSYKVVEDGAFGINS